VLRLLGLDDFGRGLAGHEFGAAALGQVAGEAPTLPSPASGGGLGRGHPGTV
jgi:hypothetical protein